MDLQTKTLSWIDEQSNMNGHQNHFFAHNT